MNITLDLENLTIGDIEDAEKLVGYPILGKINRDMPADVLKALVVVRARKDDPSFGAEQARSLRIADLDATATVDPTSADAHAA